MIRALLFLAAAALAGAALQAQSPLAPLGLTESAARTFVLNEIRSPAADRRNPMAIAGTRAFLALPRSARGAAATGLFAWAKAYATSPAFRTSYDTYREGVVGPARPAPSPVDDTVTREMEEERAAAEEFRKNLAASGLPPAEQEKILAAMQATQAQAASPAVAEARRKALEAERAGQRASDAASAADLDVRLPADPQRLVARRLREFLDATADVNFAARTISLTGGPDGIEFLDPADRRRPWIWQLAAIAGPEATAAARAAAGAWLREVAP